jgi:hypothetical protein
MALSHDQRRALRLLADEPNGGPQRRSCWRTASRFRCSRAMRAGRRPIKVAWLMITDAGRRALG